MVLVPLETPVTSPALLTVAVAFAALQVPPVTVLDIVMVAPAHTNDAPLIVPAFGNAVTVTTLVATAEPQALVTV